MKIKLYRRFFCFFLLLVFSYLLSGCATIPRGEPALTSYNIRGITYFPLVSLCEIRNISWDYDTFSRKVTLMQGSRNIELMVDSSTVLVNGMPKDIKYPVDIYNGAVVVPERFKKDIFDPLFKPLYKEGPSFAYGERFKVIIDPGHGGVDPGAIGRSGIKEKHICLDIARRLRSNLNSSNIEVILTRDYDKTLALSERTQLANAKDIDLFVSIHANANRVGSLNGFEIYYLSPRIDDAQHALISAKNSDLKLKNLYFLNNNLNLEATVWDLVYTQNRAESIELSRHICRVVNDNLNTRVIGIKGAPFYVLKNTKMPAVLIEVGFLSNPQEERLLRNNFYRQQIAEAIALGIRRYCEEYSILKGQGG